MDSLAFSFNWIELQGLRHKMNTSDIIIVYGESQQSNIIQSDTIDVSLYIASQTWLHLVMVLASTPFDDDIYFVIQ